MSDIILKLDNREQALEVFTGGKLPEFLEEIKKDALLFVADVTTLTGRKAIASKANDVAKQKVAIDNVGKGLVADWKNQAKIVDASRKSTREFLDNLKIKVRKPLSLWEEEERLKAKKEFEELQAKKALEAIVEQHEEALSMNVMFDKEKELEAREKALRVAEEARVIAEQEAQDEADRLFAITHAEERAKEKAEKEAEEKIKAEKRKAIEAEIRAKQAQEDLRIKLQKDKDDFIAAEKKKAEIARLSQEKLDEERRQHALKLAKEEELRIMNKIHQKKIATEAKEAFIKLGFDEENSLLIVRQIIKGNIPNITINF